MKGGTVVAIGFTALIAVTFGIMVGNHVGYRNGQADAAVVKMDELKERVNALDAEIRAVVERLEKAEALVFTRAVVSYYGADHEGVPAREHGRLTASGKRFNAWGHTFACWHLPFGTVAVFRYGDRATWGVCEDRGPAFRLRRDLDISYAMARELGMLWEGVVEAEWAIVKVGEGKRDEILL